MELKLNFNPLKIQAYMMFDIPKEIFEDLKFQSYNYIKNNFSNGLESNYNLYGAIEREYELQDTSKLKKLVDAVIPSFFKFHYRDPKNVSIDRAWINFQKKYEHNPLHNHDGDISFVIWIKIPYNLEEERNVKNVVKSNNFHLETTAFTFYYTSNYNPKFSGISKHIIQVDKTYEGKMIIFDSCIPHSVYPFYTSDDYRISIAGNLKIENSGN